MLFVSAAPRESRFEVSKTGTNICPYFSSTLILPSLHFEPAVEIWAEKISQQNMPKAICPAASPSKKQGDIFKYCLPCVCGKKVICNDHWTSVKQYCKVCEAATEELEEGATVQPCTDAQTECANVQASSSAIPAPIQTHAPNGPAIVTTSLEAFLAKIDLARHHRLFVARHFTNMDDLRAVGAQWSDVVLRDFLRQAFTGTPADLCGEEGLTEEELRVVERAIRALKEEVGWPPSSGA
ncbi:hypothetical protein C8R46DRAFT_1295464 [Mycena filopes]|nr:hypothetical protein C8R46DRAFT_1295464 [Mycena filopes]